MRIVLLERVFFFCTCRGFVEVAKHVGESVGELCGGKGAASSTGQHQQMRVQVSSYCQDAFRPQCPAQVW